MVNMISVLEIIRNVQSSCDHGPVPDEDSRADWWLSLIKWKAGDSGFGLLVDSILEHGMDPESPIGYQPESGYLNEGHHRLVAAILLGLDEIAYTPYGGRDNRNISAHNYWSDHSIIL